MTATIDSTVVADILAREHTAARAQRDANGSRPTAAAGDSSGGDAGPRGWRDFREAEFYQHAYLAIGPDQGGLLYLLARACGARNIVEFGSSFGISTLYLAAAAEDNDGHVIGSEYYANKRDHALQSLDDAGLSSRADIRLGDAIEIFADLEGPIDFLFLDGDKSLYLPVLESLAARLAPGAWIVADNLDHFAGDAGDFRHFITHNPDRFTTRIVPVGRGCFSVSRCR